VLNFLVMPPEHLDVAPTLDLIALDQVGGGKLGKPSLDIARGDVVVTRQNTHLEFS